MSFEIELYDTMNYFTELFLKLLHFDKYWLTFFLLKKNYIIIKINIGQTWKSKNSDHRLLYVRMKEMWFRITHHATNIRYTQGHGGTKENIDTVGILTKIKKRGHLRPSYLPINCCWRTSSITCRHLIFDSWCRFEIFMIVEVLWCFRNWTMVAFSD